MDAINGLGGPQQPLALSFPAPQAHDQAIAPASDLAKSQDIGYSPTIAQPAPFPLAGFEDHTTYTTTDLITIAISVTRVVDGPSGPRVEHAVQTIDETVTTTEDSLHGTKTTRSVTATQPIDTAGAPATAAQAAAVKNGQSILDQQVTVTDERSTTETVYSTSLAQNPAGPPGSLVSVASISVSQVAKAHQVVNEDQALTLPGASATSALNDVAALAATYTENSTLAKLLKGPYAPQFLGDVVDAPA